MGEGEWQWYLGEREGAGRGGVGALGWWDRVEGGLVGAFVDWKGCVEGCLEQVWVGGGGVVVRRGG